MIDFTKPALFPNVSKEEMAQVMARVFAECQGLRSAGQLEYAGPTNAFGNFCRIAEETGTSPEATLWTYAMKHKDGIASYIRGHRSQRESVRGRINDLIVYLCLFRGMVEFRETQASVDALPVIGQINVPSA